MKNGQPFRIFRSDKAAVLASLAGCRVQEMQRYIAIGCIRELVRIRAGDACERCGTMLTSATGEMHETLPRGKGGEISLANSEWLCHDCHTGRPDSAHGDRRLHFGEVTNADPPLPARSV
jgi:5-methylcytosine-specific restriction endonuclease McrA